MNLVDPFTHTTHWMILRAQGDMSTEPRSDDSDAIAVSAGVKDPVWPRAAVIVAAAALVGLILYLRPGNEPITAPTPPPVKEVAVQPPQPPPPADPPPQPVKEPEPQQAQQPADPPKEQVAKKEAPPPRPSRE